MVAVGRWPLVVVVALAGARRCSPTTCSRCPSTPSPSWSARTEQAGPRRDGGVQLGHRGPPRAQRRAPRRRARSSAPRRRPASSSPRTSRSSSSSATGRSSATLPDLTGLTQAEAETRARPSCKLVAAAARAAERRERRRRLGDLVVGARRPVADDRRSGAARHADPARDLDRSGAAHRPDAGRAHRRPGDRRAAAGPARRRPSPSRCSATPSRRARVVSANPADGTTGIPRGTAVTITPSKGVDLVVMPDLTGQTLAQAQATLAAAGLQTGALARQHRGDLRLGHRAGPPAHRPASQFKRGSRRRHDVPAARSRASLRASEQLR